MRRIRLDETNISIIIIIIIMLLLSLDEEDTTGYAPFAKLALSMEGITGDRKVLKKVLREGVGELVPEKALCKVHYNGYLEYQDVPFDCSRLRKKPLSFRLGRGEAIVGWDIGLKTMRKDEIAKFLISHEYAYGKMGCPPRIPPKATVLFEVSMCLIHPSRQYNTIDSGV